MSVIIEGENRDYGDCRIQTFASAFRGNVHLSVRRDEGTQGDPDRNASLDISPTDARHLAVQLIEAAAKAEQ